MLDRSITKLCLAIGIGVSILVGLCWVQDSFADGGSWVGTGSPSYSDGGYTGGSGYYGGDVCDDDDNAASFLQCQGYSWIFYRYIGDKDGGEGEGTVFRPDSSVNVISSQCTQHEDGGFWHFGYNMRGIFYSDYYSVFGNWEYVKGLDSRYRVTYSTSLGGRGHAETLTKNVISPDGYYGWVNYVGDGHNSHYFTHSNADLDHTIYVDGGAIYEATSYSSNPYTNSNAAVLQDYKRACKASGGSDSECAMIPDDAYAFCYWPGLEPGDNMGRVRILGSSSGSDNYDTFSGWKKSTDWVKTEKEISYTITDCPENGCPVQFRHYLTNTKKNGTAQYRIVREYIDPNTFIGKKTLTGSDSGIRSNIVNIKPGQKVCETLYWSADENTEPGNTPYARACAEAEAPSFQGRSNVWDADHTTGWFSSGNKDITYYIENCDAAKGCNVALSHHLKRNSGSGITQYDITKETNGWNREPTSSDKTEPTVSNLDPFVTVLRDTYTLYPGEKICETLNFSSKGDGDKDGRGTVCAVALGTSTSSIDIKVRNDNLNGVNEYGQYHESTYAKPGDSISYLVEYTPTLQYTYNTIPNKLKVDGGNVINNNNNKTLGELFNDNKGSLADWNNAFRITGDLFDQDSYQTPGDSSKVSIDNLSATAGTIAGQQYTERAETNPRDKNDNSIIHSELWTTPSQIEITKSSNEILMDVSTGQLSDEATAYVPYNFENTTSVGVSSNGDGKILYAGEKENITFDITVGQRYNRTLEGTYATRVEGAKWKIQICYDGGMSCDSSQEIQGTLNDNDSLSGITKSKTIEGMPIRDVPAGTKVKVKTMVYPIQSYNDLETDSNKWRVYCNSAYDHCWSSAEADFTIAKKPSFQVWGGSLYSAGNIFAPSATKTSLAGFSIGSDTYTFGSWAELSLATSGENSVGSGAGLGYERNYDGTLQPNESPSNGLGNNARVNNGTPLPGGSKNSSAFCTVTFAGTKCGSSDLLGTLSASSIALPTTDDFIATLKGEGYTIYENPDDITNPSGFELSLEPDNPIKRLYSSDGDITISGNIIIGATDDETRTNQTYANFSLTPSIIIYTTGRINIQCGVTRIDATLIAGGTINTCSDEDADSLKKDSTGSLQLTINGALSANRIDFNRTYGAATGENSIVPAEIINYDSSLVLDYSSGTTESTPITLDDLTVQYIHELAPRY